MIVPSYHYSLCAHLRKYSRAFRLAVCALVLPLALTACSEGFTRSTLKLSGNDLRVQKVSVIVEPRTRGVAPWTDDPIENKLPPKEYGLTKRKIASDFTRVLEAALIPASASGNRPVIVQVRIDSMYLPRSGQNVQFDTNASVTVYVDVIDVQTSAALVSQKGAAVALDTRPFWGTGTTQVQTYNLMLSKLAAELKEGIVN
ncbi:hypothetical protein [Shimia thalassica]|uniref:hypothetical protein n=1 Tax=Shimia thalassica TaxID=1715693 RepID=UPI0026E1383E|nr:hypothetical protein [Shimia thalassica]MDO6480970.1 hypothetical protein [Shimia thalassica]